MSYHNTSTSAATQQSTTNAQGKIAPAGYHYMPDGTLMSDAQHAKLYGVIKRLMGFNLDTSDIKRDGETRKFDILGDKGAVFSLEVKNGNNYYNFTTNLFQATQTKLNNISITGGSYTGNITFPNKITTDTVNGVVTSGVNVIMDGLVASTMEVGDRVTGNAALDAANVTVAAIDVGSNVYTFALSESIAIADDVTLSFSGADQYDFYLFAEENTEHYEYREVRLSDDSIDINSSTGSNSNLVQKVIYQPLPVTITINSYSPESTVGGTNTTLATITTSRGNNTAKIPFTHVFTVGSGNVLTINRQPISSDIMAFIGATIGANPVNIPGEDIYPTVTAADKVVYGEVSGTNVTMDDDVGTAPNNLWAIGDRITGNAALDARTQATAVTVTAVNVGSNAKVFTMSEAVDIDDGETLSFSNRRNYRWPISSTTTDLSKITPGMRQLKSTFFATQPIIKDYLIQDTVFEGELNEYKIDRVKIPGLEISGKKPLIARDSTTKVITTTIGDATNPINVTFSKQALSTFGGGAHARIFAYGTSEVERLTGYDIEFSGLAIALTKITTTTTASTTAAPSTSVAIASRAGIVNGISAVTGVGVDFSTAIPTVASGGGAASAGTIVLSAVQALENGTTLTFSGGGTVATLTGNIKVNKVGNEDITLRFDRDKFLTQH